MLILTFILILGISILFYTYFGYGILLWILKKLKIGKSVVLNSGFEPEVTLIVAAYNEEAFIRKKIENTLKIDYPKSKIKFIFITDGSTDGTADIIQEFPIITHLHENTRKGKVAAIQRAMKYVQTPITVFCDANTFINEECIKKIVPHYGDARVGGVAGEKKILTGMNEAAAGTGEGLYWKYESFLKSLDSDFNTVVGAAGELFSIRTELYEHPGDDTLLDDFVISLTICKKGFKIVYEPAAFAIEEPSESIMEERKRKIRISAGGFQSIVRLKGLLNIFKYGKLSFQYISHRVLRWTICPILLPIVFIINLILLFFASAPSLQILFVLQSSFYLLAFIGWFFSIKGIKFKVAYAAFYFVFMNIALYIGFFRFVNNTQSVLWEKASRKNES